VVPSFRAIPLPPCPDVFRKATLVVRKTPDDNLGVPDAILSVPDGNLSVPGDVRKAPDAARKITSPEGPVNTGLAGLFRTASGTLRATSVRLGMTFGRLRTRVLVFRATTVSLQVSTGGFQMRLLRGVSVLG